VSASGSSDPTGKSQDRRKLIAVLYADMVGYSRLIGLDDAGTLHRLRALRQNLIDPIVGEHGGRIVQTGGDSLLIVFDSIDGAVRCAVQMQERVPIHDSNQPADRAIRFRVGINLGDAIADGTDLHGDAVNVAARLQAECPAGGICVSRSVRDHVHGRVGLAFEPLGQRILKNIASPVETFVLGLGQPVARALPLPDKPALAVLPFSNISNDPEQEYFVDGLVEDIITALSRMGWLFVVARNSSFAYKGRAVDVRQVGQELGVRYVLEGSVRKAGDRLRIVGQLVETVTGTHLWADRFDGSLDDVFHLQDRITETVAGVVEPRLQQAEIKRAQLKSTQDLTAYDFYLRGMASCYQMTRASLDAAIALFRQAIASDSNYPAALAMLADSITEQKSRGWITDNRREMAECTRVARRAIEIGKDDPIALCYAGFALDYVAGETALGLAMVKRACVLNPNMAQAWSHVGYILTHMGEHDEGKHRAGYPTEPARPQPAYFLAWYCSRPPLGRTLSSVRQDRRYRLIWGQFLIGRPRIRVPTEVKVMHAIEEKNKAIVLATFETLVNMRDFMRSGLSVITPGWCPRCHRARRAYGRVTLKRPVEIFRGIIDPAGVSPRAVEHVECSARNTMLNA
jgi:TolB-like protein/class 3 adenylate cyclase